jgi:hypothetical protein
MRRRRRRRRRSKPSRRGFAIKGPAIKGRGSLPSRGGPERVFLTPKD